MLLSWDEQRQRHQRQAILEVHYGKHATKCPMAGKRSAEMAVGAYKDAIRNLQRDVIIHLMGADYLLLSPEQRTVLHKDHMLAVDHVSWMLEAKLRFWGRIPHLFCGLAHESPEKVQEVACQIQDSLVH